MVKWKVTGNLDLNGNYFLKDLKGLPEEISGNLYIVECISLESLDHGLKERVIVDGNFECDDRFSEEEVRKYFDVGGKIKRYTTGLEELFFLASYNGYKELVEVLLEKGVGVDLKDNFGRTALMISSLNGHKELVEFLLEKGADVNFKNNDGDTPLLCVSKNGNKEIIELLKKYGAKND